MRYWIIGAMFLGWAGCGDDETIVCGEGLAKVGNVCVSGNNNTTNGNQSCQPVDTSQCSSGSSYSCQGVNCSCDGGPNDGCACCDSTDPQCTPGSAQDCDVVCDYCQ